MFLFSFCSLANACVTFLLSKGLIQTRNEFLSHHLPTDSPMLIIAWIMNEYAFSYFPLSLDDHNVFDQM